MFDQPPVHPPVAALLRRSGDFLGARPPVFLPCGSGEVIQHLRSPRGLFGRGSSGSGGRRLRLPVHAMHERLFGDDALGQPGHVCGRDVEEVRPAPGGLHRFVQPPCSEHVALEGLVDGRVERHVGRAVEHYVEVGRQVRHLALDVAFDHRDPFLHGRAKSRLAPQPLSRIVYGLGEKAMGPVRLARDAAGLLLSPRRLLSAPGNAPAALGAAARTLHPATPVEPLNQPLSAQRRVARVERPLGDLKQVKARFATKLNDVYLAASRDDRVLRDLPPYRRPCAIFTASGAARSRIIATIPSTGPTASAAKA